MELISSEEFRKKYHRLILMTWLVPPVFGLSFIIYVELLSVEQMLSVITSPQETAYVLLSLLGASWYFRRYALPLGDLAGNRNPSAEQVARGLACLQGFPLRFWSIFVVYLLIAPVTVVYAAQLYSDYQIQWIDLFRMELIGLIVAIIVGLPIFFMLLDLMGRALSTVHLRKPYVSFKTRVFLIGALTPLLIDTMLVQYYWSRTGYFTAETFFIWLVLELLAVGGSLLFVRSFSQALQPLQTVIGMPVDEVLRHGQFLPASTDELGVLAGDYRKLLDELENLYQRTAQSERELKTIFDEMQDTFVRISAQGKVLKVSPSIQSLLGIDIETITGQYIQEYLVDAGILQQALEEGAEHQGFIRDFEFRLKSASGDLVWITCNAQITTDEVGKSLSVEGVMHDITQRKRNEEELNRYRMDLEKLVAERTGALHKAQEELLKSEKLATLGQLTATVSHELRNPLGAVRAALYWLKRQQAKNDEKYVEVIERIDRNVSRCDQIVDELLDFTRVTNMNTSPVVLDQWLEGFLEEYAFPEKLQLKTEFTQGGEMVNIDTDRFQRTLINVMDNAIQSMHEDEVVQKLIDDACLSVSTAKADGRLEIHIQDKGKGMDEEVLSKIFEPLFSTRSFGVGLGMPIVRQIMTQHGGDIEISSRKGEGTHVVLWLPIYSAS